MEVRDGSGNPRVGPGEVEGHFWRTGTGWGHSGWSVTGWGTIGEVRDGSGKH